MRRIVDQNGTKWVLAREPMPPLAAGAVRLRVIATPLDVTPSGTCVARSVIGEVTATGVRVSTLRVGQRVLALDEHLEPLTDCLDVDASRAGLLPAGVDAFLAARIGGAGLTAYNAVVRLGVSAGDRVLIADATSSVGELAARIATIYGAMCHGLTRHAVPGVTVWDPSSAWERRTGPLDAILAAAPDQLARLLDALVPSGRVCVLEPGSCTLDTAQLLDGVQLTGWSPRCLDADAIQRDLRTLSRWVKAEFLELKPARRMPLEAIHEARVLALDPHHRILIVPGAR